MSNFVNKDEKKILSHFLFPFSSYLAHPCEANKGKGPCSHTCNRVGKKAVCACPVSSFFLGKLLHGSVFPVKMKNAFVLVKRENSVKTYLRISTVPRGSERSE